MEYMEINPDWTVPRSILARDYLPKLQENPFAAQYLQMIDDTGRVVPREAIDFTQYDERNFPFDVRQPPGRSNALGTVKFMFPNPHAIYLHDTPERHLFQREVRDYSSGCIRLHDPHDFAYMLLARQMRDPEPYFQAHPEQPRADHRAAGRRDPGCTSTTAPRSPNPRSASSTAATSMAATRGSGPPCRMPGWHCGPFGGKPRPRTRFGYRRDPSDLKLRSQSAPCCL